MFQQRQPQQHFRGRLHAAAAAALRMAFPLGFIHRVQQFLVFQQLVDQLHPRLPQALDILGQTSMPQRWLLVTGFDHGGYRKGTSCHH